MMFPDTTDRLLVLLKQNGWAIQKFCEPVDGADASTAPPPASTSDLVAREAAAAYGRIRRFARWSPLEPSAWLSRLSAGPLAAAAQGAHSSCPGGSGVRGAAEDGSGRGPRGAPCRARIKLESEQHTGSFKVRGALHKLLSLPPDILRRGVFTASTGNHALAVLYACAVLNPLTPAVAAATGPGAAMTAASNAGLPSQGADAPAVLAGGATLAASPSEGDGGAAELGPVEAVTWPAATLVAAAGSGAAPKPAEMAKGTREHRVLLGDSRTSVRASGCLQEAAPCPAVQAAEAAAAAGPCQPAEATGLQLQLYVPQTASPYKLRKLRDLGGRVHLCGTDCLEAETAARTAAAAAGAVYVSPYNDLQVMAGQGTVALELLAELRRGELDVVLVPVGGGGLIGGMAAVLKAADPGIRVVGCQPAASDVMARSVAAGAVQPETDAGSSTLSDATAGGVEADSLTLQPCVACVDEWVAVGEDEIAAALVEVLEEHSKLVEGAAACAIAAYKRLAPSLAGRSVVVVACGGNIAVPTLQRALQLAGRDRVNPAGSGGLEGALAA